MKSILVNNKSYIVVAAFYLNVSMLLDCLGNFFVLIDKQFILRGTLQKSIYFLLIILLWLYLIQFSKNWLDLFTKGCLSVIVFLTSLLLDPQIHIILFRAFYIFFADVFCVYCIISNLKNLKKFEKVITIYIYLSIIYAIILLLMYRKLRHGYSMDFSYRSFPLAAFSLLMGLQKRKKRYTLIFIFILITNLIAGSRGVLLCNMLLFVLIYMFTINSRNCAGRLCGIVIFSIGLGVMLINMSHIGNVLQNYMPNSRTIEFLAEGKLNLLTGREGYYSECINAIIQEPLKIRGVLSDRIYIGQQLNKPIGDYFSAYAHNFIIELCFQYGIIGMILCFIMLFILVNSFKKLLKMRNSEPELVRLFMVSISYAVGQLAFSNSYITSIAFGMACGTVRLVNLKWKEKIKLESVLECKN